MYWKKEFIDNNSPEKEKYVLVVKERAGQWVVFREINGKLSGGTWDDRLTGEKTFPAADLAIKAVDEAYQPPRWLSQEHWAHPNIVMV